MLLYIALTLCILTAVALDTAPAAPSMGHSGRHFLAVTDFGNWERTAAGLPGEVGLTSPVFEAPFAWDELIVSWNAETLPETYLKVEARGINGQGATKYYTLGLWSPGPTRQPRESVKLQKDQQGDVLTDTLALKQRVRRAQLRITLGGADENTLPRLKLVGLCFLDSGAKPSLLEPNRAAWGKIIPVPERSQVGYPDGRGWCSPTSVSMALSYWATVLNRPELDQAVPAVAHGVYDRNWPGTGNWPFNTAFAGAVPGLRAYVTRLADIAELEDWIVAGIPVILSVSYDTRTGQPVAKGSGHILVCVGFTRTGDVVVNDPWAHLEQGQSVRKVFPRRAVAAGWSRSHNTVYLIYPEAMKPPLDRFGHWAVPGV